MNKALSLVVAFVGTLLAAHLVSALRAAPCPYNKCFYKSCIRISASQCRVFRQECQENPSGYMSNFGCSTQNWPTQTADTWEADYWDIDSCTAQCDCDTYPIEAGGCQQPTTDPLYKQFCGTCSNSSL
jgi:hypothetical protein